MATTMFGLGDQSNCLHEDNSTSLLGPTAGYGGLCSAWAEVDNGVGFDHTQWRRLQAKPALRCLECRSCYRFYSLDDSGNRRQRPITVVTPTGEQEVSLSLFHPPIQPWLRLQIARVFLSPRSILIVTTPHTNMLFGPPTMPQRQLLESAIYADLLLKCKDGEIKVHRAYVNIASPVVQDLYNKAIGVSR
jgi:hypothetical protein